MFINYKNHIVPRESTSGFGLIEVMISAMILSISLLGIASIQSRALNIMIEASRRETAYRMIGQLSNFAIMAEKDKVGYLALATPSVAIATCYAPLSSTSCDKAAFYQTLVREWTEIVGKILPKGQGCTCISSPLGTNPQPTITLRAAIKWVSLSGVNSVVMFDNEILSAIIDSANASKCPIVTLDLTNPSTICNFT